MIKKTKSLAAGRIGGRWFAALTKTAALCVRGIVHRVRRLCRRGNEHGGEG